MGIIEKIFGTHSENELKRIYPLVDRIESMEPEMKALSDEELKGKTREFKERLGEGETLDDILPDAFAVCREAAWRGCSSSSKPTARRYSGRGWCTSRAGLGVWRRPIFRTECR